MLNIELFPRATALIIHKSGIYQLIIKNKTSKTL